MWQRPTIRCYTIKSETRVYSRCTVKARYGEDGSRSVSNYRVYRPSGLSLSGEQMAKPRRHTLGKYLLSQLRKHSDCAYLTRSNALDPQRARLPASKHGLLDSPVFGSRDEKHSMVGRVHLSARPPGTHQAHPRMGVRSQQQVTQFVREHVP